MTRRANQRAGLQTAHLPPRLRLLFWDYDFTKLRWPGGRGVLLRDELRTRRATMLRQGLWVLVVAAVCLANAPARAAGEGPVTGTLTGNVLAAGDNRVMILSPEGKIVWEHKTDLTHDAWMLPNGNVLFADGSSVTEVTPDKKVVFQYKAKVAKGGGTYACQRLENGNTFIGENSTGRVLEVDKDGKVVFEMPVTPAKEGEHHNMRMARKLKNGNYLVCHSGARTVKEYTPKGDVVLELKVNLPGVVAFAAIRTPKDTTIVAALQKIIEYDSKGAIIWEFAATDIPGVKIRNITGIQLLPDGNIAAGCYSAYDKGEGTGLFEITRDKKLVWRFADPKTANTMMAIQKLDKDGKPLPGECLR